MKNIKHIVYLMLENRSLDNVLGWLYSGEDQPINFIPKGIACGSYDGLEKDTYYNTNKYGNKAYNRIINW